jgi:regulator of replication initiation timing
MPLKNHEAIINLLTDENARLKQEVEELKEKLRQPITTAQKKHEVIKLRKSDVPKIVSLGGCGSSSGVGGGCGASSGGCGG